MRDFLADPRRVPSPHARGRPFGWFVHHQGRGHAERCAAIVNALPAERAVTIFCARPDIFPPLRRGMEIREIPPPFEAPGTPDRLIRDGFYLFVGAIEPKKNLRRLIEAYLASGVPEPLVVVGRKAWQYEDVVAMMTRSPRIIYLDYLPFAQMITLMRAARALVFPSLYEGFGLPVLEAFLCGTPVITADASSTGEIAGGAALLVDPYDTRAIRDAIRHLSADESGVERRRLAEAGCRQAQRFEPAAIARCYDDGYRAIAG